jgi:outer membrane protein TolC
MKISQIQYSMERLFLRLFYLIILFPSFVNAQQIKDVELDLMETVRLANDSSLAIYRVRNGYLSDYWAFQSFKAARLPSLSLSAIPAQYSRDFVKRYNSEQNVDTYRRQSSYYGEATLNLQQNIDFTGGTLFAQSGLSVIRNFGDNPFQQFSSIPIRVGYQQDLIGYNPFKWSKLIAPLKFTKAEKKLIYGIEENSEATSQYFFDLAIAQNENDLAQENLKNADTLYKIGIEKFKILSMGEADLLTLKLDMMNARNAIQSAKTNLKRATFVLTAHINKYRDAHIKVKIPDPPQKIEVNISELLRFAKENNPDILEGKQQVLASQQALARTKIESQFNISFNATVGYSQIGGSFSQAYRSPLQQTVFSLGFTIPIIDWGVRKGNFNVAKSNLSIINLSAKETETKLERELIMTIDEFSTQSEFIQTAFEALQISRRAYEQNKQRFIIGKTDINSLTLSTNRMQNAQRNYMAVLKNYWQGYFKLRKLSLYDINNRKPIRFYYPQ